MEFSEDRSCFVCGRENPAGLQAPFSADLAARRSFCRLAIPPGFQGWREVVHGGVISALLDEAAIYACRQPGESLVTAELRVRFRKPVPVSREVEVFGEVLEEQRRVIRARSRLELDGVVHAEAEVRIVRVT